MARAAELLSVTDFAELTGVSRERLRTWERRHGFPVAHRHGSGPRRYDPADVPRVIAVRHAVAAGVPVTEAVARAAAEGHDVAELTDDAARALVEDLPAPVVVVSGPRPLRVVHLNAAARARPGAPRPGEELAVDRAAELDGDGGELARRLLALFARDVGPTLLEHPALGGREGERQRSLLFRLALAPGSAPLAALVGLEAEGDRRRRERLRALEDEATGLRARLERTERWLELAGELADRFRTDPGSAGLTAGAEAVVRRLGAIDAALCVYMTGQLTIGRSTRGLLGPEIVTVTAFDDLATVLREGRPDWLSPTTAAAFGAPADLALAAAPVLAGGEPLGTLLLLFDSAEPMGPDVLRMLGVVTAGLGFLLLRERFVGELREPRPAG